MPLQGTHTQGGMQRRRGALFTAAGRCERGIFLFFFVRVCERCRERCGGKEGQAVQRGELHLRRPASFRLSETY